MYDIPFDNSYYYGGSYFYDSGNTEPTPEIISQIGQADDVSTTIKPTTTYTVQGQTAQEAWDNAKNTPVKSNVGGIEHDKKVGARGETAWNYDYVPSYTFRTIPVAGGSYKIELTVDKAFLTLSKNVLMPKWEGYATASQEEKDKWDTKYNSLRNHETGHENIAESGITKVANALDSEIPFTISFFVSNPSEVRDVANPKINEYLAAAFNQARDEVQAESDQYDVSTNYGEN